MWVVRTPRLAGGSKGQAADRRLRSARFLKKSGACCATSLVPVDYNRLLGDTMGISRRDTLKFGGLAAVGAAGLTLPLGRSVEAATPSLLPSSRFPKLFEAALVQPPLLQPVSVTRDASGKVIKKTYDVAALANPNAVIVPGLTTPILGYTGIAPGPRIDVDQGVPVELTVRNRLPLKHPTFGTPTAISTHLHGSPSLPQYDGYASDITQPGQKKSYQYPNSQPARTLWYHDHAVHFTAQNAYSGLAAQYHLHDTDERRLLPQGEFDVPLTLSDMIFNANGTMLYDDRSHSGLWGDVILVNGTPWPTMKVKKRVYRFRLLNASISRSYRPTLSTGEPVHMVATDGGLMPIVQKVTQWRHGNAERYEFLIDFSKYATGQRIELRNLSNPDNRDFDHTGEIMAFDVTGDAVDTTDPTWNRLPTELRNLDGQLVNQDVMGLTPASAVKVRTLKFERKNGFWAINGETWDDVVASGFTKVLANPALNSTEIWEIQNPAGGWFHPVHIHLVDFKILSRNGQAPFAYEKGPKDTVYVGENETVRVIAKFGPHRGKYMMHCHNLPHEDHDMMHQYSVGLAPGDVDPNDPIKAAPPTPDNG
jgi:FtsP/CotA-like multicopper oxidase with cupredoxin domain